MIINDIQKAIEIGRFALSKDVPRQDRGAVAFGLFKCIFDYCNNNEIRDLFAVTLKYTIEKFESSNYPTFKLEPVGKPFELPGTSKQWVYVHFQIPSSQENYAEGSRVVLEAISHAI